MPEQSGEREPPMTRIWKSQSYVGGPVTAVVPQEDDVGL
jgi:hypothetical protein